MSERNENDDAEIKSGTPHRRPASRPALPAGLQRGDLSKRGGNEGREKESARARWRSGVHQLAHDWPEQASVSLLGEEGEQQILCMPHECVACDLGRPDRMERVWGLQSQEADRFSAQELDSRSWAQRAVGYGVQYAQAMLVAEWPKHLHTQSWEGDVYQGVFGLAQKQVGIERQKTFGNNKIAAKMLEPLESLSLYHTSALKCMASRSVLYNQNHKRQCLLNHLGPEIETVQPLSIVCFGRLAKEMVAQYWFKSDSLRFGDILEVAPPKCWNRDVLYILAVEKPSCQLTDSDAYFKDEAALKRIAELVSQ